MSLEGVGSLGVLQPWAHLSLDSPPILTCDLHSPPPRTRHGKWPHHPHPCQGQPKPHGPCCPRSAHR